MIKSRIRTSFRDADGDTVIRVVIVESNNIIKQQLISFLRTHGVHIEKCFDQIEGAVAEILELKPDAVFMDVVVSGKDGLTAARKVMENDKDIKLIFIAEDGRYASDAFSIGAVDYLLKPLKSERLYMAMKRVT
jgi:two-component SAPR family response regulator